MIASSAEHAVELLDRAFAQGDLDAVLGFYEEAAVVITGPGKAARGMEELRSFFAWAMQSGSRAEQLRTQVIEADGVALFLSRWTLHSKGANGTTRTFTATTVFRKQPDGGWKALIDNPFGPLILETEQTGPQ
jgi:ketosteroid isomerase-like protein